MTGIERLRELANATNCSVWACTDEIYCESHDLDGSKNFGGKMRDALSDIADQIEREQCGRVSRMRVLSVITDMERHVLGHEGMDDSPVARWASELREALGGNAYDHSADVSVSAYDMLPQEDRDAIAWVRKHGGLDYVRAEWRSRVPRDLYERRRQRLLGHIAECETALRRRNGRIKELGQRMLELMTERAELRRRAMPEGMEWLVEAWPRFEDGKSVKLLDDFERYGEETSVSAVTMYADGSFALNCRAYSKGERVNRPAPKVLDADGVEIRVGDTVWHVEDGREGTVRQIVRAHDAQWNDTACVCVTFNGSSRDDYILPDHLTHRAPVLAADGRPLREGETVWLNELGLKSKLVDRGEPLKVVAFDKKGNVGVLDRDGIVLGETSPWWFSPSCLTHERPEIDSWERLEEDVAGASCPDVYCANHHVDASDTSYEWAMARDIVRRAKALAERDAE